ncbi:MAG: signal peptidase I, partial [bacterium]
TPTLQISDRIMVSKLNYMFQEPARFEAVVFAYPRDPSRDFIKRIVGLPGEHLEVRDGYLYINNNKLVESFEIFRDKDNFGPVDIPGGCYFVMGDNRSNSSDSRAFGFLPRDYIIGKAMVRIWPLERVGFLPQ